MNLINFLILAIELKKNLVNDFQWKSKLTNALMCVFWKEWEKQSLGSNFSQGLKILNLTLEIGVCVCRRVQCAFISFISEEVKLGKNSKICK